MTINENNFEAYMLDYLNGNLDPLTTAELMAFLAENPGFEQLLPEYKCNYMPSCKENLPGKTFLKKDFSDVPAINEGNFDEFCIAFSENLLKEADRSRLADYLKQNPEKKNDFNLYQQLKLRADKNISYAGKSKLKRQVAGSNILRYTLYTIGMAASLALLFVLISRNQPEENLITIHVNNASDTATVSLPVHVITSPAENNTRQVEKTFIPYNKSILHEVEPVIQNQYIEQDSFKLKRLMPITNAVINSRIMPPPVLEHQQAINYQKKNILLAEASQIQSEKFPESILGSLIKKLNFWKAAETVVLGFNYLTEAQLSLDKIADESGKFTGLSLNTESYSISGNKMK
jgi:hypothetical protein